LLCGFAARCPQASQAILPPWLQRHIDRALSALPADEKVGILPGKVSIAVQVDRDFDCAMDQLTEKLSSVVVSFARRKKLVSAFCVWHAHFAQGRILSEREKLSSVVGSLTSRNELVSAFSGWHAHFTHGRILDAKSARSIRAYVRRLMRWGFLCWENSCDDARNQGLTITLSETTLTSTPVKPAGSTPRVMGMSPPPPQYESPRQNMADMRAMLDAITPKPEKLFKQSEDIRLEMTLDLSIEQIQGAEDLFKESIITDLAWALDARRDKIKILRLQAGSVIVILLFEKGISGEKSPLNVAHDLQDQVREPHSKLTRGQFTSKVTSLSLLPLSLQMQPVLLETSPAMQQFSAQHASWTLSSSAARNSLPAHDGGMKELLGDVMEAGVVDEAKDGDVEVEGGWRDTDVRETGLENADKIWNVKVPEEGGEAAISGTSSSQQGAQDASDSSSPAATVGTPSPGRLRRLLWRWAASAKRHKHIYRQAAFWMKRSELSSAGTCALTFRTWFQRKRDVSSMIVLMESKCALAQMQYGLNVWTRFLQMVRLERKADWIYVRRAG
jgi:hypothetical protein